MHHTQDIQTDMGVTYKTAGADEEYIRLVNRDPDNLLVSWIPGGRYIMKN